jgi:hypothetical protein
MKIFLSAAGNFRDSNKEKIKKVNFKLFRGRSRSPLHQMPVAIHGVEIAPLALIQAEPQFELHVTRRTRKSRLWQRRNTCQEGAHKRAPNHWIRTERFSLREKQ